MSHSKLLDTKLSSLNKELQSNLDKKFDERLPASETRMERMVASATKIAEEARSAAELAKAMNGGLNSGVGAQPTGSIASCLGDQGILRIRQALLAGCESRAVSIGPDRKRQVDTLTT